MEQRRIVPLISAATILVLLLAASISLRRHGSSPDSVMSHEKSSANLPTQHDSASPNKPQEQRAPLKFLTRRQQAGVPLPEPAAPPPPRESWIVDTFTGRSALPTGYLAQNVKATPEGIRLADTGDGSTSATGTVETPPLTLTQPSNAMCFFWRRDMPDGTHVKIELSYSADMKTWTDWKDLGMNDDPPMASMPDGNSNPNYGAIHSCMVANGLRLYPYARYRATLEARGRQSPTLQQVKLWHCDSTLDQGYLASAPPSDIEKQEESPTAVPPAGPLGTKAFVAQVPSETPAAAQEN